MRFRVVLSSFFAFLIIFSSSVFCFADVTVYITRTGECYHASGCSYLHSKIEISLNDAVAAGYRACSRCHPPTLSTRSMPSAYASTDYYDEYLELGDKVYDLTQDNRALKQEIRSLENRLSHQEQEFEALHDKYKKRDIFAGIGGFSLAIIVSFIFKKPRTC